MTTRQKPSKQKTAFRIFTPDSGVKVGSLQKEEISSLQQKLKDANEPEQHETAKHKLLWKLMGSYIPANKDAVQGSFVSHLEYTVARSRFNFDSFSSYLSCSYSVRDRLIELFNDTQEFLISQKVKSIYYVSIEFLMGRFLRNALLNLEIEDIYKDGLHELDVDIDSLYTEEYDAGLGNGGLGRLAACFIDSLATLNLPGWGYGLMYSFGMFKQTIGPDGSQMEIPDYWLDFGDPWRIRKPTVSYPVYFYGHSDNGVWHPSLTIIAVANDFLIPGFATDNTLALRLWSSKPTSDLDEEKFRFGDYYQAVEQKQRCENLTSVLYPNDNTPEGKEMRLMQEYLLSSASLQDIIKNLKTKLKAPIEDLPKYAAIQLNDTHPAIMVAELLRLLIDDENLPFDKALNIAREVFSYTCHTLMPEALEKWSVPLFESLLPRHLEIIYELNYQFLTTTQIAAEDMAKVSIVEESNPKQIRMANLAVVGAHKVNGVAFIHTELMKQFVFNAFYKIWPEKFCNKTNGVTVRRWLHHCNPDLSSLITSKLATENWVLDAGLLRGLTSFLDNQAFINRWKEVKLENKRRLAKLVKDTLGVELNPEVQLFDIQVKRIHEYKRQTLNILSVIDRYLAILENPSSRETYVPRAIIFGGKAAPGYYAAKKLIKLINNVSYVINADPDVGDLLKVVFIPNYNVSNAEIIIPGTDVSQHISTAGYEASGTSNMKFAFNAGLIIGTHDGANIEIGEEIGNDNLFFFGALAEDVPAIQARKYDISPRLKTVFNSIRSGTFGDPEEYESILKPIENGDYYLVAYDFDTYIQAQAKLDAAYKNQDEWVKMCITSTAQMGKFSSDRTIQEYADEVWGIKSIRLPDPPGSENLEVSPDAKTVGSNPQVGSLTRRSKIGQAPSTNANPEVPSELATNVNKASFGSIPKRNVKPQPDVPPTTSTTPSSVPEDSNEFW